MKYLLLFVFIGMTAVIFGQNAIYTASSSGSWNSAIWTLTSGTDIEANGYPDADDAAIIDPGFAITVSGTQACSNFDIKDDGSLTEFTINNGATLNVGGNMAITDLLDLSEILITINGTLNITGTFRAIFTFADATLDFTIGSLGSVSMSGNSFWRNNANTTLCIFSNSGSFSSSGSFEFRSTSGGQLILNNNSTGTISTVGDFGMRCQDAASRLTLNNQGLLNCDIDFNLRTRTGASVADNVINNGYTGSIVTLGGAISMLDDGGTITANTLSSSFTYDNATTAQTVLSDSRITYHNLGVTGAKTGTLSADIAAASILGDLTVASGTTFNQGIFTVASTKDVNNSGTITAGGNLTVGDSLINSGIINQTDTITITGNVSNSGTINALTIIDANGNFTNSGTVTSTGCNMNVFGNWDNTGGTYTAVSTDTVSFDGTGASAATIAGATSWGVLNCNHVTGLTVSSGAQSIIGVLDIDQGTFTSGSLVTLISNSSGTAQMDNLGTGSFSGNLTVQRFVAKSDQSFTSVASPVGGTTLATWQANGVYFTAFTGADNPTTSWNNCYQYNEPSHGTVKIDGWAPATNITNPTGVDNSYKGHYIYMDNINFNLSVSGIPNTGSITVPLDFTVGGGATEEGWNLIGNPYPCSIDWDLMYADAANLGNMIDGYLVYSGEYNNYGWYDGVTTGTGTGSGGATKYIPHSQSVWLQSLNGTNLSVKESFKNVNDATYLKSNNTNSYIRILLTGNINTYRDEALIFSNANYDNNYTNNDLVKFLTLDPNNAPTLFTQSSDGIDLAFNKVGANSISIPVVAKAGTIAQGGYTMDFDVPSTFMEGACITLEDLHTGIITDLRADTSYSYTTSDTTTLPRFVIHIVKDFDTEVNALSCYGTGDGVVNVIGNGITGSSFSLLDGSGNTIASGIAANDSITFSNIASGAYDIVTNYAGGCSSNSPLSIAVNEPMQVTADFSLVQDTLYLNQNDILMVNNNSLGTSFAWDFGDGNTSTAVNPTNAYITPGVYQVMLTSDNSNVGQCTEVTSKNIVVMNGPLSIEEVLNDNSTKAYVRKGYVVVEFDLENETELEIVLIDINGKKITNTLEYISSGRIDLISTDVLAKGIYIVNIIGNSQSISKKLIVE